MAVNPKGSGFFSSTPLNPEKEGHFVGVGTDGTMSGTVLGLSTGTFSNVGAITGSTITTASNGLYELEKNLTEYKKKVSDLYAENLKLETELNDVKKKLIKGKSPLIEAEAKLKVLREALLKVTTSSMGDGVLGIVQSDWDAVLEALAASLHDSVALESLLAKTASKTVVNAELKAAKPKKAKTVSVKSYSITSDSEDYIDDSEIDDAEFSAIKAKYISSYADIFEKKSFVSGFKDLDDDVPF